MSRLVVLRPAPGASQTLERARARGWEASSHPLFRIAALDWTPPAATRFEAVLMTSANAARHGGAGLAGFTGLPLYAVGAATAKAARAAGFADIVAGDRDGAAIAARLRRDGHRHIVHLAGATTRPFDETGLSITRIPVYAAEPCEPEGLEEALKKNPIVLLHSPRAARRFRLWCEARGLDKPGVRLVAISPNALGEAGEGWQAAIAADAPDEAAMFAAAAALARAPDA